MHLKRVIIWAMGVIALLWLCAAEALRQGAKRGVETLVAEQSGQVEARYRTWPAPILPWQLRGEISSLQLPIDGVNLSDLRFNTASPLPHRIAADLDGPLQFLTPTGLATLSGERLNAEITIARRFGLPLHEIRLDAQSAIIEQAQAITALDSLSVLLTHQSGALYRLTADADGLALPDELLQQLDPSARLGTNIGPLSFKAEMRYSEPLSPLASPQLTLTNLIVEQASLEWGATQLKSEAELSFDGVGRADGTIDLSVTGWETMLDVSEDAGFLNAETAARVRLALRFTAGLSGGESIDVTLEARNGVIYLGPIPVGQLQIQEFRSTAAISP